jgi:acyl-CoA synthetase (AMP-forming)/AMP-acid ligase II
MLELATLISHHARYRPEATAVVFEDKRISYRQFWARVARVGNMLRALGLGLGLGRGDKIATVSANSLELLEAYWAIPTIGATLVPLSARHPDVQEVAVFGVPDEKWGETPLAAVVLRSGANVTARALREWINERVSARYQRLSNVIVMTEFPRNAAGKTLKRELREPYWAAQGRKI